MPHNALNNVPLGILPAHCLLHHYNRSQHNYYIYHFKGHEHPHLMQEVGKLRETTYNSINISSSRSIDVDEYDTNTTSGYHQIIICTAEKIVAGCRVYSPLFYCDTNANKAHDSNFYNNFCQEKNFATSNYFWFSEHFKKNFLFNTMDIGRMFIVPHLQGGFRNHREGSFLLDALFYGLAEKSKRHNISFLMGRVILSPQLSPKTRRTVLAFLHLHHRSYKTVKTKKGSFTEKEIEKELQAMNSESVNSYQGAAALHPHYASNYKKMLQICNANNEETPALIKAYLSLSPSLSFFGAAQDTELSSVEELAIMVSIHDIYSKYKNRYLKVSN